MGAYGSDGLVEEERVSCRFDFTDYHLSTHCASFQIGEVDGGGVGKSFYFILFYFLYYKPIYRLSFSPFSLSFGLSSSDEG